MPKLEIYPINSPNRLNFEDSLEYCESLGDGWRLPSREELEKMYRHQMIECGEFGLWSEESYTRDTAWSKGFGSGNIYINPKSNINYVRAVRIV